MNEYVKRNILLRDLGFNSYAEYLESPVWFAIRGRVIEASDGCVVCGKRATQVHHKSYSKDVLLGWDDSQLIPLCQPHHFKIEFGDNGGKLGLRKSNGRLRELVEEHKNGRKRKIRKRRKKARRRRGSRSKLPPMKKCYICQGKSRECQKAQFAKSTSWLELCPKCVDKYSDKIRIFCYSCNSNPTKIGQQLCKVCQKSSPDFRYQKLAKAF